MDIKQLRYFVAIVEEGSLSGAAARIGVAQPSLSQHVKTLEGRLGAELLVRSSKGVTATDAGNILVQRAREILAAVESATEEVRLAGSEPAGRVAFGLPSSVSMVLSVPLAERVRAEFPSIHLRAVEAMSGFIRDWLQDQSIDMAVLYDVASLRTLHARLLMTEDLHFFASPAAWPLDTEPGQPVALGRLRELDLVLPSGSHGLRILIDRFARSHAVQLNVVLEMDSLTQIKVLVARGSACTILAPASAVDSRLKGELVSAPIIDPVIRRPVYLVRNPARINTRASREVETLAIAVIEDLVVSGAWQATLVSDTAACTTAP